MALARSGVRLSASMAQARISRTARNSTAKLQASKASILADRMRRLLAEGLVKREPYWDRPLRHAYQLT